MREILFRGKRVDNGEWVYGFFVKQGDETYIFTPDQVDRGIDLGGYLDCCQMYEVKPESVGQFIGLYDKNGRSIFEGDFLERPGVLGRIERIVIDFELSSFCYHIVGTKTSYDPIDDYETGIETSMYEVVGNIHDNPELSEKEK